MEFGRPIVYSFAGDSPLDLHALRSRLEAMDTAALVRSGQASAFMCSPQANMGKEPRKRTRLGCIGTVGCRLFAIGASARSIGASASTHLRRSLPRLGRRG